MGETKSNALCSVVHISSLHSADDGRIVQRECRALAEAGYAVTIVAPGELLSSIHPSVHHVHIPRGRTFWRRVTQVFPAIVTAVREMQPSIIHLHDPELLLLLPWIVGGDRTIVYDMHENLPASLEMKKWIPLPLQRPMRWAISIFERVAFLSTKVIFAESSYARHYPWVRQGTVVRNLPQVDALPLRRGDTNDRVILSYVGAMSRERGGIEMIEATRKLRQEGVDVVLVLAGPTSEEFLDEMTHVIGDDLQHFVRYLGKVPIAEAWEVIAESSIGLAMLHPHANYVESLPTKVLEYMAIGIPVIASDFPLYREVVEGNKAGICVPPKRADLLAQAVLKLLHDREEMRAMGDRGRQAVRAKFDWNIDRARLIGLYETMC